MQSISDNSELGNTNSQRDQAYWLTLAHQCAAAEKRRAAEFAGGRASSDTVDHAAQQRNLERRQRELNVTPEPRLEPIQDCLADTTEAAQQRDPFGLRLQVWTGLAAAVTRRGKQAGRAKSKTSAEALRQYALLQARSHDHGEMFTNAELAQFCADLDVHTPSERYTAEVRRAWDGLLWEKAHRDKRDRRVWVYRMRSKQRVMADLDITDPGHYVVIADAAWRSERAVEWRAYVMAADRDSEIRENGITRATHGAAWGMSRRATIEHEKRYPGMGVQVEPQFAVARLPRGNGEAMQEISRHTRPFSYVVKNEWWHHQRGRKYTELFLVWQESNIYKTAGARLAVSNRRRYLQEHTRAIVENSRKEGGEGHESDQGGYVAPEVARRFYRATDARDYRKKQPEKATQVYMQDGKRKTLTAPSGHAWDFMPSYAVLRVI